MRTGPSAPTRTLKSDRPPSPTPPRGLILLATVPRRFLDGSLVTRVPNLAPLGALGAMLESAILSLFVDLRNAVLAARHDDVDLGFLAAHEGANHFFDDAVVEERDERLSDSHSVLR